MYTLHYWGYSMYGGYYMEYTDENDHYNGKHCHTYKELRQVANEMGMNLNKALRVDH